MIEKIANRLCWKIDQERVVGDGADARFVDHASVRAYHQPQDLVSRFRRFGLAPEDELDLETGTGVRVGSFDRF